MRIQIDKNIEIPMRDGAILRADVYRPETAEPTPTILFRTPYDKGLLNMDVLTPLQAVAGGYNCVVQDTRGRFASDGEWGGIAWEREGPDTYDTVEWIAAQAWCNGNVGMAGASYLGIVQWLGAMEQPPHLKAIAPTMSTSAEFDAYDTGGTFRLDHVLAWLAFMAADWLKRRIDSGNVPDSATVSKIMEMATNPRVVMEELPLRYNPWFELDGFPLSLAQILDGEVSQTPTFDYGRIAIPTLSIGGFFDVFPRATVMQFDAVCQLGERRNAGEHRLILGPWLHSGALPHYQGEMNFSIVAGAAQSRIPHKHLQFFDRHLKGTGEPLPRIEFFLAGRNQWMTADTWPPSGITNRSLYLHSAGDASTDGGVLTTTSPVANEPADSYSSDPHKPVPTHGGRVLYLGGLAPGPLSQTHLEARDDVLVYTGPILSEEVVIVGNPSVTLFASTSAKDCDWIVKLLDVHPDGRAVYIADGVRRARYRLSYDEETLIEARRILWYQIDFGPVAWALQPGHRIRLHIQSSNFPHADRNMQTGNKVGDDTDGVIALQTVAHSVNHPSELILPVLPQ